MQAYVVDHDGLAHPIQDALEVILIAELALALLFLGPLKVGEIADYGVELFHVLRTVSTEKLSV